VRVGLELVGVDSTIARYRMLGRTPGTEQVRYPPPPTLAFDAHLDADRLRQHLVRHRLEHEQRLDDYLEIDDRSPRPLEV
jgi:hypothetical protein